MRCDEALELFSAALDGELPSAQQAQLDEHLAQCPACRALQADLWGLEEALGTLEVSAPAGLKEQIMTHLPPQKDKAKPVYWRRWCAMAACAALVIFGMWQLPRSVLAPDRSADTADFVNTYGYTAGDPQSSDESVAVASALNDNETALPAYVEGDGVNVNAASVSPPDSNGASYTTDAPGSETTPTAARKYTISSGERAAQPAEQTADALPEDVPVQALSGSPSNTDVPMPRAFSAKIDSSDMTAAEPAPETATGTDGSPMPEATMVTADNGDSVPLPQCLDAVDGGAGGSSIDLNAPVETEDPFASYCGILTVERYEPSEQDYAVAFVENGQTQYVLPAEGFYTLVEQLDSQGLPYGLTTEGDGVSPDALCGLVVVTGPVPETAETPQD